MGEPNRESMEEEEEEEEAALFAYSSSSYYVQSPSYLTLTLTHDDPTSTRTAPLNVAMSRCSSSSASTTSFVEVEAEAEAEAEAEEKNIHLLVPDTVILINGKDHHANSAAKIYSDDYNYYDHGNDDNDNDNGGCLKYLSLATYPSSFLWIALQVMWRFLLSFIAASLVFYFVTKPPPPHLSLKMTSIKQFELAEGVDSSGVATNFLSCNISMSLVIDNKSKVYGLRTFSPVVKIYFGRVPFVISQGPRMYAGSHERSTMELYAGVRDKAMYGGGRNMQDMLNSGRGLPLLIRLTFTSYFRVVGSLIQPQFDHHAHCFLIVLNYYDNKHHTQAFNTTTCLLSS